MRAKIWMPLILACATTGCTITSVVISENPSKNRPPQWTDYWALPVIVHGAVPQAANPALAALYPHPPAPASSRRVELFVDAAHLPPFMALCSDGAAFQPGSQPGRYANVAGALCDGGKVVTYATANILTGGLSPDQVRSHLEMMHLQLWQALTYGNNHPEIVHPSWMYGS